MSELTNKQARLIKSQITKLYGRNYIPLLTTDSTISIGDILLSEKDISPVIDSSVFPKELTELVEGKKLSQNITSSSEVNITTKLKGEAILSDYFKINDAGIVVQFNSSNQMFLKVQGIRQQSMKNFIDFRKLVLDMYVNAQISSKVYIVRGLVYADKYFLQFSGNSGGSVGFNLDAEVSTVDIEATADFSLKWKKDVGYNIDGSNGGVLAYRVSGVRLKRHLIPEGVQNQILLGMSESDALNMLSIDERRKLIDNDAFEVVDLTDEVLLARDSENG